MIGAAAKYRFSGDVVLSASGDPLVLHHGSRVSFERFDFGKARDGAHWFTVDEDHAASFGPTRAFLISMRNPRIISQQDLDDRWDLAHPDGLQDDRCLLPRDFVCDFVAEARQAGHDGLVILDMGDRDAEVDMFLPFHPGQIHPCQREVECVSRERMR